MGRPPAIIQQLRAELALTDDEKRTLRELYEYDGAWTDKELKAKCPRSAEILKAGVLLPVYTVIGTLYMLSLTGRRLVLRDASSTHIAPQRNLDRAYIRLCMDDYGYEDTDESTTRGLDRFIGKMELFEKVTLHGVALVGGTMSGGGFSRTSIERIITRLKSSALAYNFRVILFTPSPTRGRGLAQTHSSILTVLHHLPGGTGERTKLTSFKLKSDAAYAGPANTPILQDLVTRKHPDLYPAMVRTVFAERTMLPRHCGGESIASGRPPQHSRTRPQRHHPAPNATAIPDCRAQRLSGGPWAPECRESLAVRRLL